MNKLQRLYRDHGQSPWLDNLTRGYLRCDPRRSSPRRQRPVWASTSTKDPAHPDTLYVDSLVGPDTVTTLPEATIAAYEDHGRLARTIDADVDEADETMRRLAAVGIDMDDVGLTLENEGVAGFHDSFQQVLAALEAKSRQGVGR